MMGYKEIWIWIVSRYGPVLEHHTDEISTEAGNRHRIIHYVVIDLDKSSGRDIDGNKSSYRGR